MPTVKLTARTVESMRPPASGRLELFDEDLPGFCIRVTSNGRRSACVFYRVGPRLRRATLGTLPPLTLADARLLAREALRDAALGDDPAAGKREAREALAVATLIKDYIDAGEGRRSTATNGDYRRTLKAVVQGSPIGHQPAQQVARGELRAFLEGIARKTPIRANRVLALVLLRAPGWPVGPGDPEAALDIGNHPPTRLHEVVSDPTRGIDEPIAEAVEDRPPWTSNSASKLPRSGPDQSLAEFSVQPARAAIRTKSKLG